MKAKHEWVACKYNVQRGFVNWRHGLDICQDGIVILQYNKIMFHNKGIDNILCKFGLNTGDVDNDVNLCLILDFKIV